MKKRIVCLLLVLVTLCTMLPNVVMPTEAAGYYGESDLGNIKCTILSNSAHANYVNTMMRYHILSSIDDYRVARNLENGKSVVFFFDGCSDNVDDPTYGNYNNYHLSAYCAVVQKINGVLKVVYESENCSTIPDNPRKVSLNDGTAVPTVLDGVYNIISTNHLGRYASLRIADNSGSVPVVRCTSSTSSISTSNAINIHARSNFSGAPTNGVCSTSYSSTGCFNVGLTNDTWSEYNSFILNVVGVSNAIRTTPYSSGEWTQCTSGVDKGVVIIDRSQYKTQLAAIYGGDNSHSANSLVAKITAYTDNLNAPHTCNKDTYVYYEAAHPHYKCYKCSICGEVSRNYEEMTYVSTCEECISHTCNKGTFQWFWKEHPHYNCYQCSLCENIWADMSSSNQVKTCEQCWYASFSTSASSVALKVGESKTITMSIDSCLPDTRVAEFVYDEGLIDVTTGNQKLTFTGLKPGATTYKITIYSDSTKTHVIGSKSISVTVAEDPKKINTSVDSLALTIGGTSSQTIYAWSTGYYDGKTSLFYSASNSNISCSWGEWTNGKAPLTITANKRGTTTLTIGVKDSDTGRILDSMTVAVTVGAKAYTVKYDANGGTGEPGNQTKYYNEALTLSAQVPTRPGYTFLGWAKGSSATSAEYQPGGKVTANVNYILYAVWSKITLTEISVVTLPTKLEYVKGEQLDTTGLVLELTYSDGSKTTITSGFTVSGFDPQKEGTQSVYISYGGEKTKYAVDVHKHVYDNICDATCNTCGAVRATKHSYVDATCTAPMTCTVCGVTTGSSLGHSYTNACDTSCNRCGATRAITHDYMAATCTESITCKICGATIGNKLGHTYDNNCDASCNRCGMTRTAPHYYKTTITKATFTRYGSIVEMCEECGDIVRNTTISFVKDVALSAASYIYDGNVKTPNVTLVNSAGKTMVEGTDYTVTYESGRVAVGIYDVTIALRGNYSGTKKLSFEILPELKIITQPMTQKEKAGETVKFTVKATGDGLKYQWQSSADGKTWKNCSSSTAVKSTFSFTSKTSHNGNYYRCRVTDSAGNKVYTSAVRLYVLGVTTQPKTQKVEFGDSVKFTMKATGTGLKYQWQSSSNGKTWKNCSSTSAKKATFTFTGKTSHDGNYYRCRITDSAGNVVYTDSVRLYVLGITEQPVKKTVTKGKTAKFEVEATGHRLTYQWQVSTNGGKTWKNCASSTAKKAAFSFKTKTTHNGNYYRCRIKDSGGNTVYTAKVKLTVKK